MAASTTWERTAIVTSEPDVVEGTEPRRRIPPQAGLILAVAATVIGFALIAVAWFKASELTNSAQQIPYLISGGLAGLGLVVVGSAVLVVVTRTADDRIRSQQAEALVQALRDLATYDEHEESR